MCWIMQPSSSSVNAAIWNSPIILEDKFITPITGTPYVRKHLNRSEITCMIHKNAVIYVLLCLTILQDKKPYTSKQLQKLWFAMIVFHSSCCKLEEAGSYFNISSSYCKTDNYYYLLNLHIIISLFHLKLFLFFIDFIR